MNVSLTSIQGHLWNIAEFIKTEAKMESSALLSSPLDPKFCENDDLLSLLLGDSAKTLSGSTRTINFLYLILFHQLQSLCCDDRMEVRHGALITFFKTLKLYGALLTSRTWSICLWRLVLPLLWRVQVAVCACVML